MQPSGSLSTGPFVIVLLFRSISVPRVPYLLLSLVLAGLVVVEAHGSPPTPGPASSQPPLLEHLRNEIRAMSAHRREQALMDVNTIASCTDSCIVRLRSLPDSTIHVQSDSASGSTPDVSVLIPDLVWAYHTGPSDGISLMALAGLLYIGDEASLESLLFEGHPRSPRVRRATFLHILTFFARRYPALRKTALGGGVLSRADFRAARKEAPSVPEEQASARDGSPPR